MTPIRRGPPPAAPAPARASRPARLARACTPPLLEVRAHAATARPRLAQAHRRFSNLLGYVEANIYIKGAVGGYIKHIKQAVEGLNEIMERAYGLVSELEKLQGAAQGEVDSAVDGYLHSDETDEAAIAAEAEALRSAGWRETSAWVKTAAPEALEPGLDLGTNAGEVLGDVAARNMAAIVASYPDDA